MEPITEFADDSPLAEALVALRDRRIVGRAVLHLRDG